VNRGEKIILLDTSAYSALFRGNDLVKEFLQEAFEVALNSIILGELLSGFSGGNFEEKNRQQLKDFMQTSRVTVYPMDMETSERYSSIWYYLRSQGTPIPTNDLWIAASAMQHGMTVLTTDRHFRKTPQILAITVDSPTT